jgi:Zn-dependent protease with chaperone function
VPVPQRRELAVKVGQAVALQAGFYLLGFGFAVALLALPIIQLTYQDEITIAGFVAIWVGLWLVWALFPPMRRREDPGPRLDPDASPDVHRLIGEVAAAIGVRPPDDVFINSEANASVSARRRWLSQRRQLTLGLPIFDLMTIDQLRGIVAHELGHLHRGDLRLGPWVYGTRQAILTTLARMDQEGVGLHLFFRWYGRLYVRVSQAVSRRQEFHADRIAAEIAGVGAYVGALRILECSGPIWEGYWLHDCLPVLERGLRPPLLEGFRSFRAGPLAQLDDDAQPMTCLDPRDESHPRLEEREAALGIDSDHRCQKLDESLASELLPDLDVVEGAVVRFFAIDHREFPTIGWDEVGRRVWVARWRDEINPFHSILSSIGIRDIPKAVADSDLWSQRLRQSGPVILSPEATRRRTLGIIGMWFCLLLDHRGWVCRLDPGHPIMFHNDERSIEPFGLVDRLAAGTLSTDGWSTMCDERGI